MIRAAVSFLLLLIALDTRAVVSENALPNQAEWISASVGSPAGETTFFRRAFEIGPKLIKSVILATADQSAEIRLNGRLAGKVNGFSSPTTLDVTPLVTTGTNLVTLRVAHTSGQAAIRLMLELAYADGRQLWVVTDSTWLASRAESVGWTNAFSHGAAGLEKWGDPFQITASPDAYNSWMLARNVDRATAAETITALPGFKVELLRTAQADEDSWVSLAFDPKGRLTIAREKVGLLRMTLGGSGVENVEVIEDALLECRGLLYAYDSLYVNANNNKGFYRLRDTDGDDKFDESTLLLQTAGAVGHGRNHLALGPDGLIYLAHGDDVSLPPGLSTNSPLQQMMDDQLRPFRDQRSRALRLYTDVGHILQTDRDGSFFRVIAGGLRNPLDIAFNEAGEMFTYDADNERDLGAPWYYPTRVLHIVPGGDYGWRRSIPNIPPHAPDVLPAASDVGVGSPTGVGFGTKSHFPEKYRRAFYIADWAYGRILAIHLAPDGASYRGTNETFVSGRPLNVTDFTFGPDGAMYFTTGGRRTKSGLYRVSHSHPAKAGPSESDPGSDFRALRRKLEGLPPSLSAAQTAELIWPYLDHNDRFIRYAARLALERQPLELWLNRALTEQHVRPATAALLAASRNTGKPLQDRLLQRAANFLEGTLSEPDRLDLLRVIGLRLSRFGLPDSSIVSNLTKQLDRLYPSTNRALNHELCRVLTFLDAPNVVPKTTGLINRTRDPKDCLHYTLFLAPLKEGWTIDSRRAFFDALRRAEVEQGSTAYYASIKVIRAEAAAHLTPDEAKQLAEVLAPANPAAMTLGSLATNLPFVREWKMEDFDATVLSARNADPNAGRGSFRAAGCAVCHRFGHEGGVFGPDLTSVSSRFGRRDLLDSILNPSKAIDEKYQNINVTLKDGEQVSGLFEREDDAIFVLAAGLTGETAVEIPKTSIASRVRSEISPMPAGLLNSLTQAQILDLLAFLERGAPAATALKLE